QRSSSSSVMPPACAAVSASWTPYDALGSRFSKRSVIQRKSVSTVPFADGAYGGACSVMIPKRSTSTCRARAARENLPPIMEDNGRLAKTRPAMLTAIDADQVIFPLHADLDQAHIVLLFEWPQGQDRAEDRGCFDTDEHRRMHPAGYRRSIRSNDIEVHRMLIDLGQQCWSRNGEHKGLGRGAWPGHRFRSFAHRHQIWVHLQVLHGSAHLLVGGKCDGCSGFLG